MRRSCSEAPPNSLHSPINIPIWRLLNLKNAWLSSYDANAMMIVVVVFGFKNDIFHKNVFSFIPQFPFASFFSFLFFSSWRSLLLRRKLPIDGIDGRSNVSKLSTFTFTFWFGFEIRTNENRNKNKHFLLLVINDKQEQYKMPLKVTDKKWVMTL